MRNTKVFLFPYSKNLKIFKTYYNTLTSSILFKHIRHRTTWHQNEELLPPTSTFQFACIRLSTQVVGTESAGPTTVPPFPFTTWASLSVTSYPRTGVTCHWTSLHTCYVATVSNVTRRHGQLPWFLVAPLVAPLVATAMIWPARSWQPTLCTLSSAHILQKMRSRRIWHVFNTNPLRLWGHIRTTKEMQFKRVIVYLSDFFPFSKNSADVSPRRDRNLLMELFQFWQITRG